MTPDIDPAAVPADPTIEELQSRAMRLAIGAAALTLVLAVYARSQDLLRTDEPLRSANGRIFWVIAILSAMGFGFVVSRMSNERSRSGIANVAANSAILPGIIVLSMFQFVAWDSRIVIVVSAPLLAGASVFAAVIVRHYLLSGDHAVHRGARLVQSALTGGAAFLAISITRGWMADVVFTFVTIFGVSGLLLYQAFDGIRAFAVRRVAYAVVGGMVVAELAVTLRYWPATGWFGGAILATVFVVLMLIVDAILTHRVSTELMARNIGIGTCVCAVLAFLAR